MSVVEDVDLEAMPASIFLNDDDDNVMVGCVLRPIILLFVWGCVAQLVERRSLTGELSLSCARPAADGWPLMLVNRPL